jgi:hypothetical protein
MSRVLVNKTTAAFAVESSPGVLPTTGWEQLEPNELSAIGPQVETIARTPISRNRQRVKGIVSQISAGAEISHDLTNSWARAVFGGFLFAQPTNRDLSFRQAPATAPGYTVPALDASQAARLQFGATAPVTLVHAAGYLTAANNGMKPLTANPVTTDTTIPVAGLVAEPARPQQSVELAGVRADTADLALTVTGAAGVLTSGNGAGTPVDFTTLGLTPGQWVHVGGLLAANRLAPTVYGYARVVTVAADSLTLDKLSLALVTSAGAGVSVDLLFGQFIRNVPVDHADYRETTLSLEMTYPDLGGVGVDNYEYVRGLYCSELTLEMEVSDKAVSTATFVGLESDAPTAVRATGADGAALPGRRAAYGTASDFARIRLTDIDETGISTDFKSLALTINNNVAGEYILGRLSPAYVNAGILEVDLEATALFTDPDVLARVVSNQPVTMDFVMRNDDGALVVDLPHVTLGNGERELPPNESVNIATTAQAFEDPVFGVSLGVSLFPATPE